VTADGDLNLSEIAAWEALYGSTIKVTKVWDQSGGGQHLPLLNPLQRATLLKNGIGLVTRPLIFCDSLNENSSFATAVAGTPLSQPISIGMIIMNLPSQFAGGIFGGHGTYGGMDLFSMGNDSYRMEGGVGWFDFPFPYNTWYSVQCVWNGLPSSARFNGTVANPSSGNNIGSVGIDGRIMINSGTTDNGSIGSLYWHEYIVHPSAASLANQALLESNQRTYAGI
jgi:hypothetical protein